MGLGLEVGILADLREEDEEGYEWKLKEFESINNLLRSRGLEPHNEPNDCEIWSCSMWGYSGFHYLRRLAAYLDSTGTLPPPGDDDIVEDPIIVEYLESVESEVPSHKFKREFDHLIVHSDCEGFYLPIDFEHVLAADPSMEISGGVIGSTHRLLKECEHIASILNIPSQLNSGSRELTEAAASQGAGDALWQRYGVESYSCVWLIQACKKSIETGAAIVFC